MMLVILWVQVEYKYCPYEHTEEQIFLFFANHKCSNTHSLGGENAQTHGRSNLHLTWHAGITYVMIYFYLY